MLINIMLIYTKKHIPFRLHIKRKSETSILASPQHSGMSQFKKIILIASMIPFKPDHVNLLSFKFRLNKLRKLEINR